MYIRFARWWYIISMLISNVKSVSTDTRRIMQLHILSCMCEMCVFVHACVKSLKSQWAAILPSQGCVHLFGCKHTLCRSYTSGSNANTHTHTRHVLTFKVSQGQEETKDSSSETVGRKLAMSGLFELYFL